MALIHLRGVINHCRYSHFILKSTNTFYTATTSLMKDFVQDATMCTSRQFSVTCLGRNLYSELPNHTDNSLNNLRKNNLSTCSVQLKNMGTDIVSEAMKDMDLEGLAEQVRKERIKTKDSTQIIKKIKEAVAVKCDEMLANLGPEDEKKLKILKLEYSFMFSEGCQILNPEEMLSVNWLEALQLPSKSQRLKYYEFVSKRKFIKEASKQKLAAKKQQSENMDRDATHSMTNYEHGRIFMRIYETTMRRWLSYRLATSMMFGIPLVIDMDYASYMRPQEIRNTASQLHDVYTLNRSDEGFPFHLHFTNCEKENPVFRQFQFNLHEEQGFLATVSEQSYLNLFDKESLVYLSPNGRQVMTEFDPNAVYIIGAYNDKSLMQPISYARAKEYKINCQRLPLDNYTKWNLGSKSLTLDQMIKILISVKNKEPWQEAFKAIPKRKVRTDSHQNDIQ
uniref:RNA (guanine-9-)-methyltransferase domain-containing protein 1 n=1 Tax=Arion vulgaris TaxID=1028688 RepID=A0A0B6ZVK4_9EUPU